MLLYKYSILFFVSVLVSVASAQTKEHSKVSTKPADLKQNKSLARKLDSIVVEDQKYRLQLTPAMKEFGSLSPQVKNLWKTIKKSDSSNLIFVTALLDKYGWLGPDEVGQNGNMAYFLVIQHADLKTQEKYLPVMKEAVSKGKAFSNNLALLEDRIAIGQGKKQIYGSQIIRDQKTGKYVFAPIEDEGNVNKRRESVGLEPIEDYAKQMNVKYEPPKY
jgi:hypothetical protein